MFNSIISTLLYHIQPVLEIMLLDVYSDLRIIRIIFNKPINQTNIKCIIFTYSSFSLGLTNDLHLNC